MLRRQQKRQEQCKSLRLAHTTDNILTQDYSVKGRVFRDLQNKRPIDRFSYVVKWFEMGKQEFKMAVKYVLQTTFYRGNSFFSCQNFHIHG